MKQNITIKPELKIKQTFNSQKEQSLKILSYNAKSLKEYLYKQAQTNPFLTYTADADAFLEYDHTTQSLYDKIEAELKSTNQTIPEDLYQYLISIGIPEVFSVVITSFVSAFISSLYSTVAFNFTCSSSALLPRCMVLNSSSFFII